ncbi:hypothetical protein HK098_003964 [Nowakowskiella sp. JEL0407]|nr:hypothetical protein HK098_003964 [Nowakowskiella sp. JEL0407]
MTTTVQVNNSSEILAQLLLKKNSPDATELFSLSNVSVYGISYSDITTESPLSPVPCTLSIKKIAVSAYSISETLVCLPSTTSNGITFREYNKSESIEQNPLFSTYLFVGDSIAIPLTPSLEPQKISSNTQTSYIFSSSADSCTYIARSVYKFQIPVGADPTAAMQISRLDLLLASFSKLKLDSVIFPEIRNSLVLINDYGEIVGQLDGDLEDDESVNNNQGGKDPVYILGIDRDTVDDSQSPPSLPPRPEDIPPELPPRPSTLPQLSEFPPEPTQPKYVKGIIKTSELVSSGIIKTSNLVSNVMSSTSTHISSRINPSAKPIVFKESTLQNIQNVHRFSGQAVKTSKKVTKGVVKIVGGTVKTVLSPLTKSGKNSGSEEKKPSVIRNVAGAGMIALDNVMEATDVAVKGLINDGTRETTSIIAKKYGEEAGQVSGMALGTVGNCAIVYVDTKGLVRKAVLRTAAKTAVSTVFFQSKDGKVEEMVPADQAKSEKSDEKLASHSVDFAPPPMPPRP